MKAMLQMLREHKAGKPVGIYSLCSAHPLVLEAGMRVARERREVLLIEATANQVNQFGGYTGMTPVDFREFVLKIAARVSLPADQVLLGGDHLGPTCWRSQPAAAALALSAQMVAAYVAAGFRKIHLDCSMTCADDPAVLSDSVVAARAADLCVVAEKAWRQADGDAGVGGDTSARGDGSARGDAPAGDNAPVYVIGTEVPTPGGAAEALETLAVTTPQAVDVTLEAHRAAFADRGLTDAWQRVVALVVQPGVEFDHHKVIDYVPSRAQALARRAERERTLVYEAHSTDYQTPASLHALVRDHFAILKVGPAATFALRETLWALADIAREMQFTGVSLKDATLQAMRDDPKYWQPYYHDADRLAFDLQFSLSDRIRYYWNAPVVVRACAELLEWLASRGVPLTLISQYLPRQYSAIREGSLKNEPRELVIDGVAQVLRPYAGACNPPSEIRAAHDQRVAFP